MSFSSADNFFVLPLLIVIVLVIVSLILRYETVTKCNTPGYTGSMGVNYPCLDSTI